MVRAWVAYLPIDPFRVDALIRARLKKSRTRGITPDLFSIGDPDVRRRAEADWSTLGIELSALPDFEERFTLVRLFYQSLPWPAQETRPSAG